MRRLFTKIFICISVLVFISGIVTYTLLYIKSNSLSDFVSGNILLNSDFRNNFNSWNFDGNCTLTNINKINTLSVICDKNKKIRLWQDFNVISGQIYNLKFDLLGKQSGVFVIFRDNTTGNEEYLWCKGTENQKSYNWNIKTKKSGRRSIYFIIYQVGNYYFTNISLCNKQIKLKNIISVIILNLLIILIILLVVFKSNSKSLNILFLIIICTLAIIPIIKINNESKSEIENRNLSLLCPLINNGKINVSFGINFNDWLNDRFFERILCLQVNTLIRAYINNKIENEQVLAGRDRWYFRKENLVLLNNHNTFISNYYSKTMNNLLRLSKCCNDNDTDLYILVMPCNEEVYDDMLIGIKLGQIKYAIAQTIEKLKMDTDVNIIYGCNTMDKAKKEDFVCYKTDHHWTKFGAFRNYQKLMNEINKNNEGVIALDESDFIIKDKKFTDLVGFGSLFSMLNIPKWCWSYFYPMVGSYKTFSFKGEAYLKKEGNILFNYNGIDKCVLVFGDSMTTNIIDFFWDSFKKTILHREYGNIKMKNVERIIHNNKPDIAIMIIYYDNFYRIKNWYN